MHMPMTALKEREELWKAVEGLWKGCGRAVERAVEAVEGRLGGREAALDLEELDGLLRERPEVAVHLERLRVPKRPRKGEGGRPKWRMGRKGGHSPSCRRTH